jgi:hypothetical protein
VWAHVETGAEDPGGYIGKYSTWEDDAHSDGVLGNQLVAIEAGSNNA